MLRTHLLARTPASKVPDHVVRAISLRSRFRPRRPALRPNDRETPLRAAMRAFRATGVAMAAAPPVLRDIVLIGGGHSHLFVLRSFGMKPVPGVRITLVTRDVHTPYSGMLPGFVAGFYRLDDCHVDLAKLATFAGARLVHAEAAGLDPNKRVVLFKDRPPLRYDVLSIDIGITPASNAVPGAALRATPVKPIDRFVGRIEALLRRAREGTSPLRIVVVGGGAAGAEIACALDHRLKWERSKGTMSERGHSICIVARSQLLGSHAPYARRAMLAAMAERGIEVREGAAATEVVDGEVVLSSGARVPYDELLWCTQAALAPWAARTGLALDEGGFLSVDTCLQSVSHPGVFAAGDCAGVLEHPRPKAGVFAVRQGPPLAENLRRVVLGEPLKPFIPQSSFLSLVTTGGQHCIGTKAGFGLQGAWLWNWKDSIDRAFMRKFSTDLPKMTGMAAPADADAALERLTASQTDAATLGASQMRCAGCGSKLGPDLLSRSLARVDKWMVAQGHQVVSGIGDDAAVARAPEGAVMIQSVDFFRACVGDPFVLGRIAAVHALSDLHAMGARGRTALAIATVPYAREDKMEEDMVQLLSGVCSVLAEEGCVLAGGHSAEAAEMQVGLTVTGWGQEDKLMRKGGMRAHDALILTKPLGSGTIFAADMRGGGRGRYVADVVQNASRSNLAASQALLAAGATACTDCTGFGLLGHIKEMVEASGDDVGVELWPNCIPILEGAEDTLSQGYRSTLAAANEAAQVCLDDPAAFRAGFEMWPIVFDPQTAGGLIATVPSEEAQTCLQQLRAAGYDCAMQIGRVVARDQAGAGRVSVNLDRDP